MKCKTTFSLSRTSALIIASILLTSCGYIGGEGWRTHSFLAYEEMREFECCGPYNNQTKFVLFDTSKLYEGQRDYRVGGVLHFKTNNYKARFYFEHCVLPYCYNASPVFTDLSKTFEYYLVFYQKIIDDAANAEWTIPESMRLISTGYDRPYYSNEEENRFILKSNQTILVDMRFYGVPSESYEYYDEEAVSILYQKIEEIKEIVKNLCIQAYDEYSE